MMPASSHTAGRAGRRSRRLSVGVLVGLAFLAAVFAPASANAAITVFGSGLSVPATLNTTEDLGYPGMNTAVPPGPEAPDGVFHTFHFGADTALWNTTQPMPAGGEVLKVSLEGCAQAAVGGPAPLTQIHFQDISPLPGGGAKVDLTSSAFEIPVCGRASGSTVTTYEPSGLCVNQGDYVAFNDEGGYVENVYRDGVPYEVLGSARGSTVASFIKGGGTGNGAIMSPSDMAAGEGFAYSENEELMMRVTLGTGPNARYVCPGGSKDAPAVLPPIDIHPQTDGINRERIVAVAIYCRLTPTCQGVARLTMDGKRVSTRTVPFSLPGDTTSHLPIRLLPRIMKLIHKHGGVVTTITAVVGGQKFSQTVSVKIL